MIVMVNEKFRENVADPWSCFHKDDKKFHSFFAKALRLREEKHLSMAEETYYVVFMINCFQSLEDEMLRDEVLRYALSVSFRLSQRLTLSQSGCVAAVA